MAWGPVVTWFWKLREPCLSQTPEGPSYQNSGGDNSQNTRPELLGGLVSARTPSARAHRSPSSDSWTCADASADKRSSDSWDVGLGLCVRVQQ